MRRQGRNGGAVGARSKGSQDLFDDAERLPDLIDAHSHPSQDIAFKIDRHLEGNLVISGVRMIPPKIAIHSRSTPGTAHDPEIASLIWMQNPGSLEAVAS